MPEEKKNSKFITSIIIGGALGSLAAWLFGNRVRRKEIAEKTEALVQDVLKNPKKKNFFQRFLGK